MASLHFRHASIGTSSTNSVTNAVDSDEQRSATDAPSHNVHKPLLLEGNFTGSPCSNASGRPPKPQESLMKPESVTSRSDSQYKSATEDSARSQNHISTNPGTSRHHPPSPHLQRVYRTQGVYSETGRGSGLYQPPPVGALSEDGRSRSSLSRSQSRIPNPRLQRAYGVQLSRPNPTSLSKTPDHRVSTQIFRSPEEIDLHIPDPTSIVFPRDGCLGAQSSRSRQAQTPKIRSPGVNSRSSSNSRTSADLDPQTGKSLNLNPHLARAYGVAHSTVLRTASRSPSYAESLSRQESRQDGGLGFDDLSPPLTPTTMSTSVDIPRSQSEVSNSENSQSQLQAFLSSDPKGTPVHFPNVSPKTPQSTPPVNAVDSTILTSVHENLHLRPATSENRDPDETPRPTRPVALPTTGVETREDNHNSTSPRPHTSLSQGFEPQPSVLPDPIIDSYGQGKDERNKKGKAKVKVKETTKPKPKSKKGDQHEGGNQRVLDQNRPKLPHDVPEPAENAKALKKGKTRTEQPIIAGGDWIHSVLFRAKNLYQLQTILEQPGPNRTQFAAMYPYTNATPMGISVGSSSNSSRSSDRNGYSNTPPDPRPCPQERSEIGQENPSCDTRPRDTTYSQPPPLPPGRAGQQTPLEHGNQAAPLFVTGGNECLTPRLPSLSLSAQVDDIEMHSQDMQPNLTPSHENQSSTPEMRQRHLEVDDRLSPLRHTAYRQLSPARSDRFMDVDSQMYSHSPRSHVPQSVPDLEPTSNSPQSLTEPCRHDHPSSSNLHTYPSPPVGGNSQPHQCLPNGCERQSDAEDGYEAGAEDGDEHLDPINDDQHGDQYEDHEEPNDLLEELDDNPRSFSNQDMENLYTLLSQDMSAGLKEVLTHLALLATSSAPPTTPATQSSECNKTGPKLVSDPKRRSFAKIEMAKSVREHISHLLGENYFLTPMVTSTESWVFSASWNIDKGQSCEPCCSLNNFRIDLFGPPTCPWNISAARVFCRDFTDLHGLPEEANVDVVEHFLTRVKTLKAAYRAHLRNRRDPEERGLEARGLRRQQRKYKLFVKRLTIAWKKPHLRRHTEMLQRFGPVGMSSDESSGDERPASGQPRDRYHICQPQWRSSRVTTWLRTLDVVHLVDHGLGRGRDPRLWISDPEAPRLSRSIEFVTHLHRNAYDEAWLGGRNDINFVVFPAENYDFSHDPEALDFIQQPRRRRRQNYDQI